MSFLIADPDYYELWNTADPGPRYRPAPLPPDWTSHDDGAWTHWGPPGLVLPDQGWKVHVSSSLANAQPVLTVVSLTCAELGIPFKHLAGKGTFLVVHDKHAPRPQSGKFCTLYPPTQDQALELMRCLSAELSGISGPYVLTDRRFGESECVSYRYGAIRGRLRTDAEGNHIPVMTGPDGQELDDERLPRFHLPAGVTDPFREAAPTKPAGSVTMNGYTFEAVLRHSNAGGAYRFRAEDGATVFVKEARSHNGYTADGADAKTRLTAEYLTLLAVHGQAPGLCPRPVELFHHWEHTYLATELVPGVSLYRWMVTNNPAITNETDSDAYAEYHRRALVVLDRLAEQVSRLHELGYVFIDLSPTNVLVDEDDHPRLVDWEAVQPATDVRRYLGTPGYLPQEPRPVAQHDPHDLDRFGLSALALLLVYPAHELADRHPAALNHVHADLTELAPVEPRLWQWATQNYDQTKATTLPTPQAVRDNLQEALRELAERTADALEAMARPDNPGWVYPPNPLGYETDTRNVAAGTAGVLLALHRAGRACDPKTVRRLRDEALAEAETSAPGLLYGSAGIAGVLAELGEPEAAERLLTTAAAHPLNTTSATLGGGAAGTALGLLAHHRRTDDQRWLDLATKLLEQIPTDEEQLTAQLSRTTRSGLVGGRTGVALALHTLYQTTKEEPLFTQGMRLLGEELTYAEPLPGNAMGFRTTKADRRVYPYVFAGSAGYAAVLSRYVATNPNAADEEQFILDNAALTPKEALNRCLKACTARFAIFPGLFQGLAGLIATLNDAADRIARPDLKEIALTNARGLFKYAIPHAAGAAWQGEPGHRLSTDLWSGSAGVLLTLTRLTREK